MAREKLDCPNDCPLQELCIEKSDTVEFALAGLEAIKQQADDIKVDASEGITLAREFHPAVGHGGVHKMTNIHHLVANKALDITLDQEQLMIMLSNDLKLWRMLIDQMRERCEGPKKIKRFRLFGQEIIRCSIEPSEVVDMLRVVRSQLIEEAAAEFFSGEASDA